MTIGTIRAALLLVAMAASTFTASATSMEKLAIGCSDYEEYRTLSGFIVDRDLVASQKYAFLHDCRFFDKATKVFVSKKGIYTSCIRQPGNTTCYWVDNEYIDRRD